ncbi:MAG: flap endonuclease-1 [Promethearchaeota archaeon]
MGIKINELVNEIKRPITFENLNNRRIAIDAFNTIYQFLAIIRQQDGTPLKDYKGNVTSHLTGLFYRTINFIEYNIKPIYVFDGEPTILKLETLKERRQIKKEAREKMFKAQDEEDFAEAKKYAQMTSKLDDAMIEESKKLLTYMGIPVVEAKSEGEAQSAYLVEKGDAWACASQDYDTLLFGGKRLLRNFAIGRSKKVKQTTVTLDIEYISLSKFLEKHEITREQLIDMGILIGTDFFPGIKGIGQHKALGLIKKYGTLEEIIKNESSLEEKLKNLTPDLIEQLRDLFLNPKINKDYPPLKWNKVNYEKVIELLVDVHDFSKVRVENALERLKKLDSNSTQLTLDKFIHG